MKTILTFVLFTIYVSQSFGQGWTATDLSSKEIHANGSMVEHKGKLFVQSAEKGISVSTDGGQTFTDIQTDTIYGTVQYMVSAGDRLYVAIYGQGNAAGFLWYSEDEGLSWKQDSAGAPQNFINPNLKRDIYDIISYNNGTQLLATWGNADYYMRKATTDNEWTKISYFDPIDPLKYCASNDTVLAVNSNTVYMSTDNAVTWKPLPTNGLANYFVPRGFDMENGRLYLVADATIEQKIYLYYTDDLGNTWDTLPINHLLGKNWLGNAQFPTSITAIGNSLYLPLTNNANNTPVNMITSDDNGATFYHDTTGFKNDQFGTGIIKKIIQHKGKILALNSFQTLYIKDDGTSGITSKTLFPQFNFYPNPTKNEIHIHINDEKNHLIEIYNALGQMVFTQSIKNGEIIKLSHLPNGNYWLKCDNITQTFIKY